MGAINHYWLIPLFPAQTDTPLSFDINHDFVIIDPLLTMRGKRALLILISNLHPSITSCTANTRDMREKCWKFIHMTTQYGVNKIKVLPAFSSLFLLESLGEEVTQ